jgi:hypothetical protein
MINHQMTDSEYALKAAVRRAVKIAGGPNAVAKSIRVDASRLSHYGNPEHQYFAPIDVCVSLDQLAGDHIILRAWADLCGLEVTTRGAAAASSNDLSTIAGRVALESGQLVCAAIEADADGIVTIAEARKIDEAAADVEEKVIHIRRAARRVMTGR